MQLSGRRAFQGMGTASAKALWWKCARVLEQGSWKEISERPYSKSLGCQPEFAIFVGHPFLCAQTGLGMTLRCYDMAYGGHYWFMSV